MSVTSSKRRKSQQASSGMLPIAVTDLTSPVLGWGMSGSLDKKKQRHYGAGQSVSHRFYTWICVWGAFLVFSAGCAKQETGLTDQEFSGIFVAALGLHGLHADNPDTLLSKRAAMFRQHGISEGELERSIVELSKNPEKWETTLAKLQVRLESDTAFVNRRNELGAYAKGKKYGVERK